MTIIYVLISVILGAVLGFGLAWVQGFVELRNLARTASKVMAKELVMAPPVAPEPPVSDSDLLVETDGTMELVDQYARAFADWLYIENDYAEMTKKLNISHAALRQHLISEWRRVHNATTLAIAADIERAGNKVLAWQIRGKMKS